MSKFEKRSENSVCSFCGCELSELSETFASSQYDVVCCSQECLEHKEDSIDFELEFWSDEDELDA